MIGMFLRKAVRDIADLKTQRLRLVAITPEMLKADGAGDGSLGRLLGARVTAEWPPEHWESPVLDFILRQYRDEPDTMGWHRFMLYENGNGRPTLIGCVGGFPRSDGVAEIGYSTLPAYQRRGFATEATSAFIDYLFSQERVQGVTAQTFPRLPESIKVMERCGMTFAGEGYESGAICYRRTRQSRVIPDHQR